MADNNKSRTAVLNWAAARIYFWAAANEVLGKAEATARRICGEAGLSEEDTDAVANKVKLYVKSRKESKNGTDR
jgi:hypothetical protein